MWLLAFGLLLCGAGVLVGRYGYGAVTRDGWNGMDPGSWKVVGGVLIAVGITVAVVGNLPAW